MIPRLVARKLAVNHRVICASPSYLEKYGIHKFPQDLKNHNCLMLTARSGYMDWKLSVDDDTEVIKVSGNFGANEGDALREAALAGMGIARLASYSVGQDLLSGKLIQVLPEYTISLNNIYAVYPHRRHLSLKVKVFIEFLLKKFSSTPPWQTPR